MFTVHHIASLDLPALAPYRTMRRQMDHRKQGIFVAEGEKVVRRLLESRFGVVSLLIPEKWLADLEPLLAKRAETVDVYIAPKPVLEALTGFSMYQGLLAVGRIPEQISIERMIAGGVGARLLVAVDSLSNAENLGALIRNCAAFGVQGVITGETCTSAYLRRSVRSSMGTIFELPVLELADSGETSARRGLAGPDATRRQNLADVLKELRSRGFRCVAAHPHTVVKSVWDGEFTADTCILFGSEGYGISQPLLDRCDDQLAIPMAPGVDSLNVAAAAAVFLYEAQRQRSNQVRSQ